MIKAVIFDLDDTLYDEKDYCVSGFGVVARLLCSEFDNLSWAEVFERLCNEYEINGSGKVFNAFLDEFCIHYEQGLIDRMVECYRNHKPDISIENSVFEILTELKKRYKLGLVTDGFLPAQQLKVEALEIEEFFDEIVYTEKLGREFWKPSTKGFELICEKLNSDPKECVYVADNAEKDFIAPNKLLFAASIQIIKPNGVHRHKKPLNNQCKPTHQITDLRELFTLLSQL